MDATNTDLSPRVWGPHFWFFLLTIAVSYPQQPNAITKKKTYEFINNLPLFLPNGDVARDFAALLETYPIAPYLDKREDFIHWVHSMHNVINQRLGKEQLPLQTALDRYYLNYRAPPIFSTPVENAARLQKRVAVVGLILALVFLAIYLI